MNLTSKQPPLHGQTGENFPRDTLTLTPPGLPSPFSELSRDGEKFPPCPREALEKWPVRS
jgi:hypothetical protein